MNLPLLLAVAVGSGVGAMARSATDRLIFAVTGGTRLPWATLLVNTVGSVLLGAVIAGVAVGAWPSQVSLIVGTGVAGGLTTFSTFSWETFTILREGEFRRALGYVALSIAGGLAGIELGLTIGRAAG